MRQYIDLLLVALFVLVCGLSQALDPVVTKTPRSNGLDIEARNVLNDDTGVIRIKFSIGSSYARNNPDEATIDDGGNEEETQGDDETVAPDDQTTPKEETTDTDNGE